MRKKSIDVAIRQLLEVLPVILDAAEASVKYKRELYRILDKDALELKCAQTNANSIRHQEPHYTGAVLWSGHRAK